MAQALAGNKLPKKEAENFRNLVEAYETKQYKKGLKLADGILKKFPTNGETQAMKGIILNSLGKKAEAYELVKAGIKNDIKSHVCWHVYGLLYRSDLNYKEASKCYLNALRIDSGNQNILRDLSWLQIQMRDVSGFLGTRRRLLELRPGMRTNWVAFALASYLKGDYAGAFDALTSFNNNSSSSGSGNEAYEDGELALFHNACLAAAGRLPDALEHLEGVREKVVDQLAWQVRRALLLALLRRSAEGAEAWASLLLSQPEHEGLHAGLHVSLLLGAGAEDQDQGNQELRELLEGHLKALFPLPGEQGDGREAGRRALVPFCFQLSPAQRETLLRWYEAQGASLERSRTSQAVVL
eukprot:gene35612-43188_t